MIVFVTTREGLAAIVPSRPLMPDDVRVRTRVVTYKRILTRRRLPAATYIFTDIERLRRPIRLRAAFLGRQLAEAGPDFRVLNHPGRVQDRYGLLRMLRRAGINDFDVRHPHDIAGLRYPVFLRGRTDHNGARSDLIANERDLASAIERLEARGVPSGQILVVEFCDTADRHGIYRKYDAYIANGRVVPVDMYHGSRWMLKMSTHGIFDGHALTDAELTAEQLAHLRGVDRHDQLRAIARLAAIDYGRVDFSFRGDRLQVWEINTNPDYGLHVMQGPYRDTAYGRNVLPHVSAATFDMLRSLDLAEPSKRRIDIEPLIDASEDAPPSRRAA